MNPRALSSAASDAFHFSSGPRMDTYTFAKRRSLVPSTSVTVTNPSRGSLSSRWRTREISSLMSWFTRSSRFGCMSEDLQRFAPTRHVTFERGGANGEPDKARGGRRPGRGGGGGAAPPPRDPDLSQFSFSPLPNPPPPSPRPLPRGGRG